MSNPWQSIPLEDYEGHMALPAIGQAEMLANEFGSLLKDYPAEAVAIIGCAGGNGFEQAADAGIVRLVGLDINEQYITEAEHRFAHDIAGLELYCADIESDMPVIAGVDLIFAALVLEYVDVPKTLKNIKKLCRPGAVLGVLLQLPSHTAVVSASPYTSLQGLGAIMRLVPPPELRDAAKVAGFGFLAERAITLPSGKCFSHQIFRV